AHWLLAAPGRRRRVDYGLWYLPPPRSAADQARFYAAEVPVQALEMLLTAACGRQFHFSADNPGADGGCARQAFETAVRQRFAGRCAGAAALEGAVVAVLGALNRHWRQHAAAATGGRREMG